MKKPKNGRPRRSDLTAFPGAENSDIGYFIAVLDELSERVFDQISDLSEDALNFVPEGSYLSIGKLVIHQALDEAHCVSRITGSSIPADLEGELAVGRIPSGRS